MVHPVKENGSMTNWFPDKSTLTKPAFRSLAEQIGTAIESGGLEPGERLPPQRDLAYALGISLQTVSRAYEELRRRNLIQGEVGRGTFVRTRPRLEAMPFGSSRPPDSIAELSIYKPVLDPLHEECMKQALAGLQSDLPRDILFSFRPNQGLDRHINSAREWLRLCGLTAERNRIIITNGVTQGTTSAVLAISKPGGTIVTEEIGHHSLAGLCRSIGVKLLGLPIDGEGILPEPFERACRTGEISGLYLMPNLSSPTVYFMQEGRKAEIARIAGKHRVYIIENDVLGPLVANKPPPFAERLPEQTLYLTSFTKCLMPGLRTGYMVVPPAMLNVVRNRLLATSWMATPMVAEIASRWVLDGTARKLVLWQRRALQERHRLADQILGHRGIRSHVNALHLWLPLTGRWRPDPFTVQAMKQGVAVAPSGPFLVDNDIDVRAIRISLGAAGRDDLERGLHVIDQLLDREAEFAFDSF
jgi:DNA-binding transcriptional MocR family regulator